MHSNEKSLNLPNLTGLRAFAAILVLLQHAAAQSYSMGYRFWGQHSFVFHSGQEGVLLFFVLSGFLMQYKYEAQSPNVTLSDAYRFYVKRFARIYPLYILVTVLGFLVLFAFKRSDSLALLPYAILYILPFSNLIPWLYPGFLGALLSLWSIGMELQFYAFFPWLSSRLKAVSTFWFSMITIALFISFEYALNRHFTSLFFYFRPDFFFAGMLAANAFQSNVSINLKNTSWVYLCLMGLCIFPLSLYPMWLRDSALFISIPCLLILLARIQPIPVLHAKWMFLSGEISYGLYVWHPLVSYPVRIVYQKSIANLINPSLGVWLYALILFVCTWVLAYISYKRFEQPLYRSIVARF